MEEEYTVKLAASVLRVSEKTVLTYIKKGILQAKKWNGQWVILGGSLREVYRKKYGSIPEIPRNIPEPSETEIKVERAQYEVFLIQAGQLKAAQELLREYREKNEGLMKRIGALEQKIVEYETKGIWRKIRKKKKK